MRWSTGHKRTCAREHNIHLRWKCFFVCVYVWKSLILIIPVCRSNNAVVDRHKRSCAREHTHNICRQERGANRILALSAIDRKRKKRMRNMWEKHMKLQKAHANDITHAQSTLIRTYIPKRRERPSWFWASTYISMHVVHAHALAHEQARTTSTILTQKQRTIHPNVYS